MQVDYPLVSETGLAVCMEIRLRRVSVQHPCSAFSKVPPPFTAPPLGLPRPSVPHGKLREALHREGSCPRNPPKSDPDFFNYGLKDAPETAFT